MLKYTWRTHLFGQELGLFISKNGETVRPKQLWFEGQCYSRGTSGFFAVLNLKVTGCVEVA